MSKSMMFLVLAIMSEVAGTTALKFTDGFTKLVPSVITIAGYVLSFYLLSLCLREMSIGFAYAIWAGVGIVLIALIGVFFLNEKADMVGILGIGLIVAGVVILNNFSNMGGH